MSGGDEYQHLNTARQNWQKKIKEYKRREQSQMEDLTPTLKNKMLDVELNNWRQNGMNVLNVNTKVG